MVLRRPPCRPLGPPEGDLRAGATPEATGAKPAGAAGSGRRPGPAKAGGTRDNDAGPPGPAAKGGGRVSSIL